jgi:hypothetical protein
MCTSNLSVIHCERMAVNVLFRRCAVIEFIIKENSSAADIFDLLCHVYGDYFMNVGSVLMLGKTLQRWQQRHCWSALQQSTKNHHDGMQEAEGWCAHHRRLKSDG